MGGALWDTLRFDWAKASSIDDGQFDQDGTSLKANQIPYNMEKDIDRPCLEMFVGDYEKTRRMIELLSEIVDLTEIKLTVETGLAVRFHEENQCYLSDSRMIGKFTDAFNPLEYKLSNINQAKAFTKYMNGTRIQSLWSACLQCLRCLMG